MVGLELFFIWIPILYHGLYGVWIWWRGDTNVGDYPWQGNWLYTSQRWTGIIALIYMVQHTYYLRFTGVHLPTHPMQSFAKVQGELANPCDGRVLCHRHHRGVVALLLRDLAVRGEVGHHHWRNGAPPTWLCVPVAGSWADWPWRRQHVWVPEHAETTARPKCIRKVLPCS